jgi:NADPH:quinone reductase-like Zn-dependent oxidoreductase
MPTNQINAITVDQSDAGRLAVRRVDLASAVPGEITIRVTAISLNRGETKRAFTISKAGTVAGMLPIGAWAERVHTPLNSIAVIPEKVTDAQAATLPVVGLTALHALLALPPQPSVDVEEARWFA